MNSRHKSTLWAVVAGALLITIQLSACAATSPVNPSIVLAVWDLEDLSPREAPNTHLGNLLAVQIMAHLDASGRYKVVDRENLLKVLEELQLGSSDLADSQTRLRLGRIIGAEQMVFGAFQMVGRVQRVDLRLVDVASGKILRTASGTADLSDLKGWLQAADQSAVDIVK